MKKVVYHHSKKPTVTYYLYDGNQLTAEAGEDGKITAQYLYLGHAPVAKLEGRRVYAIHSDHLGTPRAATDQDANLVWSADYSPFGKARVHNSNTITLNLRFPGQYEDEASGFHYNYFRDYDPETGRYLTSDPIGLNGGFNLYGYVGGSPTNYVDLYGLFRFGRRPLGSFDFMLGSPASTNIGLFHEHGFYEDGSGDNVGFFGDDDVGFVGPDPGYPNNHDAYEFFGPHYDDALMRQAQQMVDSGEYNLFSNNCQDYADKLRQAYDDLRRQRSDSTVELIGVTPE